MSATDFAQMSAEHFVVCAAAQWLYAGDGWPHPVNEARVRSRRFIAKLEGVALTGRVQ
jgi:hypothetical protein